MKKTTPESVLISTLLNTGDPHLGTAWGVTPEHLVGYRDEYDWLQDYHDRYGHMPSEDRFLTVFPSFPISPDELDPRWPAHEINETYAARNAMKAIMEASQLVKTNRVAEAVAVMNAVSYVDATVRPSSLLADAGYFDDYEKSTEIRVPTPYSTLQMLTNGIGPGELWYWAARPHQGKSAFMIDIATHAAWKGQRVMMISLEMSKRQCQVRFHAAMGHRLGWQNRIDALKMLRRTYDVSSYRKLHGEITEAVPGKFDIHSLEEGFASPATVMRYASEYDLILVDYIGLMRVENGARAIDDWRCAATISNGLKEAAMAKNCRVLAASQINREGDTSGWRPPKLKFMSQTDAIAQDGDVVVTMKRFGRDAEVISLEKNRHGEGQRLFWTHYLPNIGCFSEITRDEAEDIRDQAPYEGE